MLFSKDTLYKKVWVRVCERENHTGAERITGGGKELLCLCIFKTVFCGRKIPDYYWWAQWPKCEAVCLCPEEQGGPENSKDKEVEFIQPLKGGAVLPPGVSWCWDYPNFIGCFLLCRTKIFIRFPRTLFATEDAFEYRKHLLSTYPPRYACLGMKLSLNSFKIKLVLLI